MVSVVPVESHYKDALNLVKHAERTIKKIGNYYPNDGDEIWCVFDRDLNTDQCLFDSEKMAKQMGYHIAYSNPCFELWLLLHFENRRTEISDAKSVIELLKKNGRLPDYDKSDDVYDEIKPMQAEAIERAEHRIAQLCSDQKRIISYGSNPVTSVCELVSYLNEKMKQ